MPKLIVPAPRGWLSQHFKAGAHRGIDYGFLKADKEGTNDIVAAAGGTIESIYNGNGDNSGWGNRIVINHGYGIKTTYNHFRPGGISLALRAGQRIEAGAFLGDMGQTGSATGDHLHFELLVNGTRVDPFPYFSRDLPNIPTGAPASVGALLPYQRLTNATSHRRVAPTTASAHVDGGKRDLVKGEVGNFVGFIRGQHVNGSNIWFKGHSGHYFHSSGYVGGANTAGLADLGTWGTALPAAPKPAPVAQPHVKIGEAWVVYGSEHEAYHAINPRGTVQANTYPITNWGNDGRPVQIEAPGQVGVRNPGRYWIGSSKTAAPVVWK